MALDDSSTIKITLVPSAAEQQVDTSTDRKASNARTQQGNRRHTFIGHASQADLIFSTLPTLQRLNGTYRPGPYCEISEPRSLETGPPMIDVSSVS